MYEVRCQNNDLSILPVKLEKCNTETKQRTSLLEKVSDPILDKLYKAEEYKGLICFTMVTTVVAFYGWHVLRAACGL